MSSSWTVISRVAIFFCLIACLIPFSSVNAAPLSQGDTWVTPIDQLQEAGVTFSFGLQYRVMYNFSNIPFGSVRGADGTIPSSLTNYDFFRQRMRLNLDLEVRQKVGGFMQLEFRGGFGGSSPVESDPRDLSQLNAFNRLQARGARYAYLYAHPWKTQTIAAGILPLSDYVGDTLFSADWDFNVGGLTALGNLGEGTYRAAFVRLIEGVGTDQPSDLTRDGDFWILDYHMPITSAVTLGTHTYVLDIDRISALAADLQDMLLVWSGLSVIASAGPASLNGFVLLNGGWKIKDGSREGNTLGLAAKLAGSFPVGPGRLHLIMGLQTTGDKEERIRNRFLTVQELVGTQGYWAFTHLFTANPPSDVNDLGLRIDNGGASLSTLQVKYEMPLLDWLDGEIVGGWFRSVYGRTRGGGTTSVSSRFIGGEVDGVLTIKIFEPLTINVGGPTDSSEVSLVLNPLISLRFFRVSSSSYKVRCMSI